MRQFIYKKKWLIAMMILKTITAHYDADYIITIAVTLWFCYKKTVKS
jgi:hypothetical protein